MQQSLAPLNDKRYSALASAGAFVVPALSLALPSGYSFGAALLLLAAVFSLPGWWGRPLPRQAWYLSVVFVAMGLLWLVDERVPWAWRSLDRPSKYVLVLPCLVFLMAYPPRAAWLGAGIAAGAIGASAIGLYQILVLHLPRASGYTNAIQYGDIAVLLALQSGLWLVVLGSQLRRSCRTLLALAVVCGLLASALSLSRGGWLTLVLLLPVCAWLVVRAMDLRRIYLPLAILVIALSALAQWPYVQQRVAQAQHEALAYFATGDKETSIGHRLLLWQMAWNMGLERPLLGWGRAGFLQEKARHVAAGDVPAGIQDYTHAHNEVLDLWAKHGVVGLGLLALFYGVPLWLFWPTPQRMRGRCGQLDRLTLALSMVGITLPLSYMGFGLTQVFLAHNSGNMFYLFMCALVLAMLHARRTRIGAGAR